MNLTNEQERVPLVVAAQRLGLTYRQALDAALTGRLRAERIGGRWWVSTESLSQAAHEAGVAP
jgi:hypothetical protein